MEDVWLELEEGRDIVTDKQIYEACKRAGVWLTRKQIAGMVGRSASTAFGKRLDALVDKGWLYRGKTNMPNGSVRFSYLFVEG